MTISKDEQSEPIDDTPKPPHPYLVDNLGWLGIIIGIIGIFISFSPAGLLGVSLIISAAILLGASSIQLRLIDIRLAIEKHPNPTEHPERYQPRGSRQADQATKTASQD